jgi:hypothetical protein
MRSKNVVPPTEQGPPGSLSSKVQFHGRMDHGSLSRQFLHFPGMPLLQQLPRTVRDLAGPGCKPAVWHLGHYLGRQPGQ